MRPGGFRWIAAACGALAGHQVGQVVAFHVAQAKGITGDEWTTPYVAALNKAIEAGRPAAIVGAIAGYIATSVAGQSCGTLKATVIGCAAGIVVAIIVAAIVGYS